MNPPDVSKIWAQIMAANSSSSNNNISMLKGEPPASPPPNLPDDSSSPPAPLHERSISPATSSNNGGRNFSSPSQSPPNQQQPPQTAANCMEQFSHLWQMMLNRGASQPGGAPDGNPNPLFPGLPTSGIGMSQQQVTQITKTCEELEEANNIEGLSHFFSSFSPQLPPEIANNETILRARALCCFHRGEYPELYRILESTNFTGNFEKLVTMWHEAHYREVEKQRGKALGPVDKYRVRKKYPMPKTIWDGEVYSHCYRERNRKK